MLGRPLEGRTCLLGAPRVGLCCEKGHTSLWAQPLAPSHQHPPEGVGRGWCLSQRPGGPQRLPQVSEGCLPPLACSVVSLLAGFALTLDLSLCPLVLQPLRALALP